MLAIHAAGVVNWSRYNPHTGVQTLGCAHE